MRFRLSALFLLLLFLGGFDLLFEEVDDTDSFLFVWRLCVLLGRLFLLGHL